MAIYGRAIFGTSRGLDSVGDGILARFSNYQGLFEFPDLRKGLIDIPDPSGLDFVRPVVGANISLLALGWLLPATDANKRKGFVGIGAICTADTEAQREALTELDRKEWKDALIRTSQILKKGQKFDSALLPPPITDVQQQNNTNIKLKRSSREVIEYYSLDKPLAFAADDRMLELLARRSSIPGIEAKTFMFSSNGTNFQPWTPKALAKIEQEISTAKRKAEQPRTQLSSRAIGRSEARMQEARDVDEYEGRLRRAEGRLQSIDKRLRSVENDLLIARRVLEYGAYAVIALALGAIILFMSLFIMDFVRNDEAAIDYENIIEAPEP